MIGAERSSLGGFMKAILAVLLLFATVAFAASVPSPPTGLVVDGPLFVQWETVTENIDGTPCNDLAGYRVYYSATSPVTKSSPRFDVGYATKYEIHGLVHGTLYYFAGTAFDFAGNESPLSNEIARTYP